MVPELESAQQSTELKREIARYLATGDSHDLSRGVPGGLVDAMRAYDKHLRDALLAEIERRQSNAVQGVLPQNFDPVSFTRAKVAPMIRGLFPAAEREIVLAVAERSVVFLTQEAVRRLLRKIEFRTSAWTIANIYLESLGLTSLDGSTKAMVGCNEHLTCYVSLDYFKQDDPFADYVIHEVAHLFHNCKRGTIGLPFTRQREWLLDITFRMCETFAFACELYGCISEQGQTTAKRRTLLAQYAERPGPGNQIVNKADLLNILDEAVNARNGWKRILDRCSNQKRSYPRYDSYFPNTAPSSS